MRVAVYAHSKSARTATQTFMKHIQNQNAPPRGWVRIAALSDAAVMVVELGVARILTDGSAPLEPLVRRTAQILRNRIRAYLPIDILIR